MESLMDRIESAKGISKSAIVITLGSPDRIVKPWFVTLTISPMAYIPAP